MIDTTRRLVGPKFLVRGYFLFKIRMVVQCTVVGAWVEGAVRNWFEEDDGGDGKR